MDELARWENDNNVEKIYRVVTRNVHQHHGVPHMTRDKLMKTHDSLKMGPRRLVCVGLAPRKFLLVAMEELRAPWRREEWRGLRRDRLR